MSEEEYAAALVVTNEYKRWKRRKIWVKEWLMKRSSLSYIELIKELRSSNGNNDLKNYLRMDEEGALCSIFFNICLLLISQVKTKLSSLPVARTVLHEFKARHVTFFVCPSKVRLIFLSTWCVTDRGGCCKLKALTTPLAPPTYSCQQHASNITLNRGSSNTSVNKFSPVSKL
nr:unnamed protein product [Callosobruchus chinensis]